MPTVLGTPMTKVKKIFTSHDSAYVKFESRRAHIEVKSTMNRGIQINARYKSEQISIGINDFYLASVTYRRRTFPIYIILSIFFGLSGMISLIIDAVNWGIISFIAMFLFIGIYFYTKMARLSFRLADEQDYDILLSGGAVKDSESMQLFIQKILMNALKVEDYIDDSSLSRGHIQVMGNNDHTFAPPVHQPTPPAGSPPAGSSPVQQLTPPPVHQHHGQN